MSVSLHKKIVRGHPYWYARECQRVNGKPKIIWQKYLGKAEDIASNMGTPSKPPRPTEILISDFGAPATLYDLTQQLDLVAAVDRHAGKRDQGTSVGTYITLAALNRCLAPTSKARLAAWYQGTVLRRLLPVAAHQLTSQRFWDHMSYLDADRISAIEQELTRTLVERFQVDLSCLLYDTTNFYTFIDSFNEKNSLAQRGKSKEQRMSLRIVGLALLVTKDFQIPLFHHVYPGNIQDARAFASVTETLVARYRLFARNVDGITLVYDKGNNSQENQGILDHSSYHFVGALSPVQHPDLLKIPRSRFHPLSGEGLDGVLAWRTRKEVLGAQRSLVVVYNPELFLSQCATILREVYKRTRKLKQFRLHLANPPKRAKAITVESAQKQVQAILSGRHMNELIQAEVSQRNNRTHLSYRVDQVAWQRLQRSLLGKSILFTDQDSWTDEEIVRAYRSQYHIEEAFKRMKNPHFVSWRPLHHWTDQKIRVHAFYCVLALMLTSLLRRTLAHKGLDLSVLQILSALSGIKEVALVHRDGHGKTVPVISHSKLTPLQKRLMEALDLQRFSTA